MTKAVDDFDLSILVRLVRNKQSLKTLDCDQVVEKSDCGDSRWERHRPEDYPMHER